MQRHFFAFSIRILLVVCGLAFLVENASAQSGFFYRSRASGDWAGANTWERSATVNGTYSATTVAPNSTANTITIQNGHTVTFSAGAVSVDQLVTNFSNSNSLGTLNVTGGTLTIVDGSGTDLTNNGVVNVTGGTLTVSGQITTSRTFTNSGSVTVSGSIYNTGTVTNTGTLTFQSGGRYMKAESSDAVPSATWNAGSTFEVTDINVNNLVFSNGSWNQAFANVEIDLSTLGNNRTTSFAGRFTNVLGNLTVTSTGTATAKIVLGSASITGAFITASGTTTEIASNGTAATVSAGSVANAGTLRLVNGTGNATMNVSGNFSNTGTLIYTNTLATGAATINAAGAFSTTGTMTFAVSGTGGNGTLNASGTVTFNGTISTASTTVGSTTGIGIVNFVGTTQQNFTRSANIISAVNFNIANNAIVFLSGTNSFDGTGTFTLTGRIRLGSTDATGALQLGAGLNSNIRVTGTRTYNSGSTIEYFSGSQVIGNGHPGVEFPGVNLVVNNSGLSYEANVTTLRVTGNLTLTSGNLNVGGGKILILDGNLNTPVGSSITVTSTSDIIINGSGAFGTFPFLPADQTFQNFTLNRTGSGSVTFATNVTIGNNITLTAGNLNFSDQSLTINGLYTSGSGQLFANSSSILNIGGTAGFGTFSFASGGQQLNRLSLNRTSGGAATLSGSLTIHNLLQLINGELTHGGGLTMADGATVTRSANSLLLGSRLASAVNDSYNVTYSGASALTTGLEIPDPTNDEDLMNLTINGGPVTLDQDLFINGVFSINNTDFVINTNETITMQGSSFAVNGGSFVPSNGTVIFDGISSVTGAAQFNHVQLNTSRQLTFPSSNINVSGNLTFNGVFNDGSGSITLNGISGDQTIGLNADSLYTLIVNKGAGQVNLSSQVRVKRLLNIQSGTTFNASGLLWLISRGDETENDASIGPLLSGAVVNGFVNKQRYMSAKGNVNRYISSPITNLAVSGIQDDMTVVNGSLRYYNEPTAGALANGYTNASITGSLAVGRGYLVYIYENTPKLWDSNGPINQGTITLPVTYTTTSGGVAADGWNLVGNPYPSAVLWDNNGGWTFNKIDPVISVPDLGAGGTYPTYYKSWSYTDDTGDLSGGLIAAGQAFWVHATSSNADPGGPISLQIHESAKSSNAGGMFYRTKKVKSKQLIVSLNDGRFEDNIFLKTNPNATRDFDLGLDGYKFKNEEMNISFRDKDGNDLVMLAFAELDDEFVADLIVEVKDAGDYTISFRKVEELELGRTLYLHDRFEGVSLPVTAEFAYTFSTIENAYIADRFALSFNPEVKAATMVQTFPNPTRDFIQIHVPGNEPVKVELADGAGNIIHQSVMKGMERLDLRNYPGGLYVLKLFTTQGLQIKKILKY